MSGLDPIPQCDYTLNYLSDEEIPPHTHTHCTCLRKYFERMISFHHCCNTDLERKRQVSNYWL